MQAWSRDAGRCIFCSLRQHVRNQVRGERAAVRFLSSTSNQQQGGYEIRKTNRVPWDSDYTPPRFSRRRDNDDDYLPPPRFPRRRSNDDDRAAGRPLRRGAARRGEQPDRKREYDFKIRPDSSYSNRRKPDRDSVEASSIEQDERRATSVLKALNRIATDLEELTEDGKRTKLEDLDPEGTQWPIFVRRIRKIAETKPKDRTSAQKTWWAKHVTGAISPHVKDIDALRKSVFFAFLDEILPDANNDSEGVASNIVFDLKHPTEWYAAARQKQRTIHLHVGPTNSGKTYTALKRLQESKNGFYAGPLRLLAHEVYSRFNNAGMPCHLITGDDVRFVEESMNDDPCRLRASTVEMVSLNTKCEVAVIDEIQMLADEERGWAWTRALLGAPAKEVHLCGEARVVPLIRELAASMGDSLRIHHYERLNPLRCATQSLRGNLKLLQKGDCIVSFSIMQIHELRKQIEKETGRRCAIVYGSLPPETRAQQAELFNNPDNDYDYLVASDAVGMGLNLSIKRVIFETVTKFNGINRTQLTIPHIKQIAGRAGRYRSAHISSTSTPSPGIVTCIDEADLPIIRAALETEPTPIPKAYILPPGEYLEALATTLPISVPFEYLMRRTYSTAKLSHPRFALASIRDNLRMASHIDSIPHLNIEQRYTLSAAPMSGRDPVLATVLRALATAISTYEAKSVVDFPEIPLETLELEPSPDRTYLGQLEQLHKTLVMFIWISYRFGTNLTDVEMAQKAKTLVEERINWWLRRYSANPKLRERLEKLQLSALEDFEHVDLSGGGADTSASVRQETVKIDMDSEKVEKDVAGQEQEKVLDAAAPTDGVEEPRGAVESSENESRGPFVEKVEEVENHFDDGGRVWEQEREGMQSKDVHADVNGVVELGEQQRVDSDLDVGAVQLGNTSTPAAIRSEQEQASTGSAVQEDTSTTPTMQHEVRTTSKIAQDLVETESMSKEDKTESTTEDENESQTRRAAASG